MEDEAKIDELKLSTDTGWADSDVSVNHFPTRIQSNTTHNYGKTFRGASEQSKFITPEIRSAMCKRNALKHKYYKTRAAVDWEAYRCLRNRVVATRRKLQTPVQFERG